MQRYFTTYHSVLRGLTGLWLTFCSNQTEKRVVQERGAPEKAGEAGAEPQTKPHSPKTTAVALGGAQ